MDKTTKQFLVTAAIAGLVSAGSFSSTTFAKDKPAGGADAGKCVGGNSCKGSSDCGIEGHHTCHGKNDCKGHGWKTMSKKDCEVKKDAKGNPLKWEAMKKKS